MPLSFNFEQRADAKVVTLTGEITEGSSFAPILNDSGPVTLDVSGVERVNSLGVREWISFCRALKAAGRVFRLARCSTAIVHQLNMIADFQGDAHIESVLAPYFCAQCGSNQLAVVGLEAHRAPALPESVLCPKCKSEMEFDDVFEAYFAFCTKPVG